MCGIFGISLSNNSQINSSNFSSVVEKLFKLSESRGKEASGLAGFDAVKILVHKSPQTANRLIKSPKYKELIGRISKNIGIKTLIGHSRLVTNGYEHFNKNNQPVVKNGLVAVHNGIIVNYRELWKELGKSPETDLDSEIIPSFICNERSSDDDLTEALISLFGKIFGMTSTALLSSDSDALVLATNNGSVYYSISETGEAFIFASEHYILDKLIKDEFGSSQNIFGPVTQLSAGHFLIYDPDNRKVYIDTLKSPDKHIRISRIQASRKIEIIKGKLTEKDVFINTSMESTSNKVPKKFTEVFEERNNTITQLRRCSKCTLPATFPFIEFDEDGVCNFCNNYVPVHYKGVDELKRLAVNLKRNDGRPECLVPFSGGRDSSFVLHYLVRELGLKPLAFSYDWGMITDLARRNQSRLCGELGVEHILVSADIRRKRKFIRQNVTAWLKKPVLGMVPLFMAGDKQYFYYTQKLLKENNLDTSFLGENLLETTNFKSGFAGIPPAHGKDKTYSLSLSNKISLLSFYASQYIKNLSYINSSLADTLGSFKSYYMLEHTNVNLFSFIEWDEKQIINILKKEYDWETDPGTSTTWRIGDGTAAFYNYIYYIVAGFNENDTFRSNQIREGKLTRAEAFDLLREENKPRWDSIWWYCNTIGVDFISTVERINSIKPYYKIGY